MIKVLIADDHQIIIDGIKALLENHPDIEIVGEAFNGFEVLKQLEILKIDVIIMDINMPEMGGIEATQKVRLSYPEVKVLILSMYNEKEFIIQASESGASGYILKNSGMEEFVTAIKTVVQGIQYFGHEVTKTIMKELKNPGRVSGRIELTKRETDVLRLICKELSTSKIAERLGISENTVKTHRSNLLSKVNVSNTAGLVLFAIKNELVEPN